MTSDKKAPEVDALQIVHQALLLLEPEARVRVIRAVGVLLQLPGTSTEDSALQVGGAAASGEKRIRITPTTKIDTFVSAKRPSDTYQRLACLAYFLEHHDNKTDVFAKDLTNANSDARQGNISNIVTFLDLATRRHGYFAAVGRGKKHLTTRGAAVVEALPDQAAVKSALQQHPLPKKGGRKQRKRSKKSKPAGKKQ